MTTGTKVFLALFALIVGVLVVYYGVAMPDNAAGAKAKNDSSAAIDPTAKQEATSQPPRDRVAMGEKPTGQAGSMQVQPVEPSQQRTSPPPRVPAPISSKEPLVADGDASPTGGLLSQGINEASGGTGSGGAGPTGTFLPMVGLNGGNLGAPKGDVPPMVTDEKPAASRADDKPGDAPAAQPAKPASKPESEPAAVKPPARIEYLIQQGDTFVSIADEWFGDDTKWSLIARENPTVDPQKLKIGQKVFLPPKEAAAAPIEREPVLAAGERLYTVQSGDTLIAIARDELGDQTRWEDIYARNRETIGANSATLKVGMKLKLPKK